MPLCRGANGVRGQTGYGREQDRPLLREHGREHAAGGGAYSRRVCGRGGELQDDWEAFVSHLDAADLSGKTVALYGLGDQKAYPDAFLDALGTLYEHVKRRGANVIGRWPTHGYTFTHSSAVIDPAVADGAFIGLALDEENQPDLTPHRVDKWVKRLRLEMDQHD